MRLVKLERLACVFVFILKGGSTTDPKIEGKFKLDIRGRPVNRAAVNNVRELITARVKKIDPEVEVDTRMFSDIAVIITWIGIPKNFSQAQTLITALKTMAGRYFEAWEYKIEIKLIETGG